MQMNKRELEAFANEVALNAEMDEHLGYEKEQQFTSTNSRNSMSSKRVKTEDGEFEPDKPRDRDGSFELKLVKKHQIRFTPMDNKILSLYAQDMRTREIVNAFDERYGFEISPTLVSRVTNAVIEQVIEWQ